MRYAILLSVILVTGCAQYEAVRESAVEAGRKAMSRAWDDGVFLLCDVISAGEQRRRMGNNEALAKAWKTFCDEARRGEQVGA